MKANVIGDIEIVSAQELLAKVLKVLAHPARLSILDILQQGEACVCHIEAALGYRQAYISQQLAALRELNLVQSRQEGWNIYYSLSDSRLTKLLDELYATFLPDRQRNIQRPATDCPCPKCNQIR